MSELGMMTIHEWWGIVSVKVDGSKVWAPPSPLAEPHKKFALKESSFYFYKNLSLLLLDKSQT